MYLKILFNKLIDAAQAGIVKHMLLKNPNNVEVD